jgi:murein DD-endopeptidase MepM/ murein hydrolase activator NlpD
MPSPRYTIVIADRQTGVVRRFTIGLRSAMSVGGFVFSIPILIGMGAAWKGKADVADLFAAQASLELENANFRGATAALTDQIMALQTTISDLGANAALDPSLQSSMDKLPAIVKSRAMGGASTGATLATAPLGLSSPETTFGLLRDMLSGLESRLKLVRSDVDRRNELAAATPSIWPAQGWLSSGVGMRQDPFTGEQDRHEGLDISADRGSPVFATANGTVTTAASYGAYGNLIILDHGYGLETRYGHLAAFRVKPGQEVRRGEQIGVVGSTGRATSPHLHYEVRVNGRILNPLPLLTNPRRSNAN